MEAVHTSEMSVYSNETTQRYIPEGFHLHTCHHENLKSDFKLVMCCKSIEMLKEKVRT